MLAQHQVPFNSYFLSPIEKEIILNHYKINTSLKPIYKRAINSISNYDSIINSYYKIDIDTTKPWFSRKLFQENFVAVKKKDFNLTIDPVIILSLGKEQNNDLNIYRNTRAVRLEGSLGKKITFSSEFYENQARFPQYVTNSIDNTIVIPGQGIRRNFGTGGFDFNWAEGQLAFFPTEKITLEFGNGKHFIGNGYRSLLLSDNSFNYPYMKAIYATDKFFYTKIFMSLMHGIFDVNRSNVLYNRKTANIHYFGFFLRNNIQLSFFESNIWAAPDTTGNQKFSLGYINPIPFLNGMIDQSSSRIGENNAAYGFNVSVNAFQSVLFYHQSLFDNINISETLLFNQYAMQNGFKYFDAFTITNFYLQSELNIVQPYTYAKGNTEINYTHYNQALAHPLGANFIEGLFIARYNYKRFEINYKFVRAQYGSDDNTSNYGQNIFKSLNNQTVQFSESQLAQGIKTDLTHNDFFFSYLVNPKTNLRLKLGILTRNLVNDFNSDQTIYLYFTLESALKNFYYDF